MNYVTYFTSLRQNGVKEAVEIAIHPSLRLKVCESKKEARRGEARHERRPSAAANSDEKKQQRVRGLIAVIRWYLNQPAPSDPGKPVDMTSWALSKPPPSRLLQSNEANT